MEGFNQPSVYREKLLREIEDMPEDMMPTFYRIFRILKTGWMPKRRKSGHRGSLKGVWRGSQLDDALFREARNSLYPYESQ
jgi:hypothetical protein